MIRTAKKFRNANLRQKAAKMRRCHFPPDRRSKAFRPPLFFADFAFHS